MKKIERVQRKTARVAYKYKQRKKKIKGNSNLHRQYKSLGQNNKKDLSYRLRWDSS